MNRALLTDCPKMGAGQFMQRIVHEFLPQEACLHRAGKSDGLCALCADTVPIALRVAMGKAFPQGPFKLGVLQPVINVGAMIYMVVSVVRPSPSTTAPCLW